MKIVTKLAVNTFALFIVSYIIPGFDFDNIYSLVAASVVLGVINTFIKPVLQIIALPVSILTFGVAAFLINVTLLWISHFIVPGFSIDSFFIAVIASIALSLTSWFLHRLEKN